VLLTLVLCALMTVMSVRNISFVDLLITISYKKKQWRPPSKKEERRKKPKPEEQSNYFILYSFSAFLGGCAARVYATPFCCSSWYSGFLSPRCFAEGQCCGMSSHSSGLVFFLYFLFAWWPPLLFLIRFFLTHHRPGYQL
jgi:hypothetical protein